MTDGAARSSGWRRRYAEFLAVPHVPAVLVLGLVARLPLGMTPLALILLVRDGGSGYAVAGAVAAAYVVAVAAGAPVTARLVDRHGRVAVLLPLALLHPALLGVLVGLVLLGAPTWALAVGAAGAGLLLPPVGASVRSLWSVLLPPGHVSTAYALEASFQELVFVAGPLLVAALASFSPPLALAASASAAGLGTLAFVRIPPVRRARPAGSVGPAGLLGALASPGVRALVLLSAFVGLSFGGVEMGMPAFAEEEGARELGGLAIACFALGSLLGGLVAGARTSRDGPRRLVLATALLVVGVALPLLATSVATLCVLVFVAGVPIAPMFAASYALVERVARPGALAESFAWIGTAIASGFAAGAAAAGALIDAYGVDASYLFAVGAATLATATAVLGRRVLSTPLPGPGSRTSA